MLETFGDFFVPLMRVLDNLPERAGRTGYVLEIFEQKYRNEIPTNLYTENQSGHVRWIHNVHWSRLKLKKMGFIDAPMTGIWRLTDEGHNWLLDHPDATHIKKDRNASRNKTRTYPLPSSGIANIQFINRADFFDRVQEELSDHLRSILGPTQFEFVQRSNYLQIRLDGFRGCHFELILRRNVHAIALHFESSAQASEARLQVFESYLEELNKSLGVSVGTGKFGNRGWTQVWIERPAKPLSLELIQELSDQTIGLIAPTYPILQKAYKSQRNVRRPRIGKDRGRLDNSSYSILDREIQMIRAYLEGRSNAMPEDEKLCDWVNFCYIFELNSEGRELFSIVNPHEVNPWYYERTKKLARLCELKDRTK